VCLLRFIVWSFLKARLQFTLDQFNGATSEGIDYSIMFYGGKLLSHLTLDNNFEELIRIMKINMNCAIMMDSDRKSEGAEIGDTKKRICEEATKIGVLSWVTDGREIENYVPDDMYDSFLEIKGHPKRISKDRFLDRMEFKKDGRTIRLDKIEMALHVEKKWTMDFLDALPNEAKELAKRIAQGTLKRA